MQQHFPRTIGGALGIILLVLLVVFLQRKSQRSDSVAVDLDATLFERVRGCKENKSAPRCAFCTVFCSLIEARAMAFA